MARPPADKIQILLGDCLEVLAGMEAASVDLVFCSPPYEDARTYGIDFSLRGQDWVDWAAKRFLLCLRVCRGLVAWVVEGKTKKFRWSAVPMLLAADLHRQGIHLRKPPIFHRIGIPGSGGPDWLRNDYELILCAAAAPGRLLWNDNTVMGNPPKWAPGGEMSYRISDGTRRNQWGGSPNNLCGERDKHGKRRPCIRPSHRFHTKREASGEMREQFYKPPTLANPGNVIACKVGGGLMGDPLAHENEAPFPEALAEFFIRSFCPPDGVVLDPFCGSGTTLSVALKTGRQAIGIDIRPSQIELTKKRLNKIAPLFQEAMDGRIASTCP